MEIIFPATLNQAKFIESPAYLNFFMGPRGEGKTTTGLFAALSHALEHSVDTWPIRWCIVRDTWENLKRTTLDSMRKCVKKYRLAAEGIDNLEPKVVRIGMKTTTGSFKPLIELHFFGLDSPADANALQGFEGAGAWVEEPAPAADLATGVPEECLLSVTSLRQENVRPRVQVTMNPPDHSHWTMKYRDDPDLLDNLKRQGVTVGWFEIPPGENPGITKEYRDTNRAILESMGRMDLVARLVEGKVGYIQLGEAVTPEFSTFHIARGGLPILRKVPILRGWDFGLNPTTVWMQITPLGRIHILHSIRSEHVGCEQHIRDAVRPWQTHLGINGHDYEDIGDPTGENPEARDSNVSAVTAIEEMLTKEPGTPASFEPGPIPIYDRVQPIRAVLQRMMTGTPMVQVDPGALDMIRALSGGWHRKKHPSGIIGEIVKDENSEHGDALGYVMGTKFPIEKLIERKRPRRRGAPVTVAQSRQAWMAS